MRIPIAPLLLLAACETTEDTPEDSAAGVCADADCSATAEDCREAASCDPAGAPGNCDVPGEPSNEGGACADAEGVCIAGECVPDGCIPRTGTLALTGLDADGEGSAAWNTVDGAPEPAAWGHAIDWAPACLTYAYYYMASRDHVDGMGQAFHITAIADGFPAFSSALSAAGLDVGEVTGRFTPLSLGDDAEGEDWSWDPAASIETRRYTGGSLTLLLAGEPLVEWPIELVVQADYGDTADCLDDRISGEAAASMPIWRADGASASTQAAATAFVEDVGLYGVIFTFDSLQPVGSVEFETDGRTGAFFEAASGTLTIGSEPFDSECP